MPKRNIKPNKVKPPQLPTLSSETNSAEGLESELKFDQEVLWCINQFEKLIKSGKINDAKKHESMKAIAMLKKPNVSKIEKIQLMKSYFKDYKSKMAKDEEDIQQAVANFESLDECSKSGGKFLKKKAESTETKNLPVSSTFLFNFNTTEQDLSNAVNKVHIT